MREIRKENNDKNAAGIQREKCKFQTEQKTWTGTSGHFMALNEKFEN